MAGTSTDALCWQLPAQARLFDVGETSGPWRLRRGLVRLDRVGRDGPLLVMLAEPGDWLGMDALCGQPHPWRATCVTPVWLEPAPAAPSAQQRAQWLTEALLQQPARAHAMAALRTGTVTQRVRSLLALLAKPDVLTCSEAEALRARLPALRVMAELVDAKPETVCRVLGQLLPRGSAPSDGAARWAWAA